MRVGRLGIWARSGAHHRVVGCLNVHPTGIGGVMEHRSDLAQQIPQTVDLKRIDGQIPLLNKPFDFIVRRFDELGDQTLGVVAHGAFYSSDSLTS